MVKVIGRIDQESGEVENPRQGFLLTWMCALAFWGTFAIVFFKAC